MKLAGVMLCAIAGGMVAIAVHIGDPVLGVVSVIIGEIGAVIANNN